MCRIPYTVRIQGRYVFRRRVHFRNVISKPVADWHLRRAEPDDQHVEPMKALRTSMHDRIAWRMGEAA